MCKSIISGGFPNIVTFESKLSSNIKIEFAIITN